MKYRLLGLEFMKEDEPNRKICVIFKINGEVKSFFMNGDATIGEMDKAISYHIEQKPTFVSQKDCLLYTSPSPRDS